MGEQTTSTRTLAKFCADVTYQDLPEDVVHKTKQILVDVIGLGLGARGEDLEKGRYGVKMATLLQGAQQATILGTGEKVDVASAAFANGELMHSMDWCILLAPGHISPFYVPSILALAELRRGSGRDVLLATALAHDVTSRIGVSMGNFRTAVTQKLKSFGHGCNTFGAAEGPGRFWDWMSSSFWIVSGMPVIWLRFRPMNITFSCLRAVLKNMGQPDGWHRAVYILRFWRRWESAVIGMFWMETPVSGR